MQLTIDDKKVEAREGQTLLEVAQENGIEIPFPQREITIKNVPPPVIERAPEPDA